MNRDIASTLLEVLNVEQNNEFVDYYLDYPVDLSNVIFICTANTTDNILLPLLDRIEVIKIEPYLPSEKLCIAQGYLIPNLLKEYQFTNELFKFTDLCILKIINGIFVIRIL